MWEGNVVSIHVAPEASAAMQSITEVRAFPRCGLEGDRYFGGTGFYSKTSSHGGREVALIEIEAVEARKSASLVGWDVARVSKSFSPGSRKWPTGRTNHLMWVQPNRRVALKSFFWWKMKTGYGASFALSLKTVVTTCLKQGTAAKALRSAGSAKNPSTFSSPTL